MKRLSYKLSRATALLKATKYDKYTFDEFCELLTAFSKNLPFTKDQFKNYNQQLYKLHDIKIPFLFPATQAEVNQYKLIISKDPKASIKNVKIYTAKLIGSSNPYLDNVSYYIINQSNPFNIYL